MEVPVELEASAPSPPEAEPLRPRSTLGAAFDFVIAPLLLVLIGAMALGIAHQLVLAGLLSR